LHPQDFFSGSFFAGSIGSCIVLRFSVRGIMQLLQTPKDGLPPC
jgi:hypothetical protein